MISNGSTWTGRLRCGAVMSLLGGALAFAGCTSSDSAKQGQGTAATAAASAQAASDDAAFPVYPGAKSEPIPAALAQMDMCGHKQRMEQYTVNADGQSVVDWYKSHLPNATPIDATALSGGQDEASGALDKNLTVELFQPDGSGAVIVMQMHFKGAGMQAAAKTLTMDKTSIGFTHYDPPFGSDYVQLLGRVASGDASARADAKAKMASMCPQDK